MNNYYLVPQRLTPLNFEVDLPGSKSITNRVLLIAALADRPVKLRNVLFSGDGLSFMDSLRKLGFRLEINEAAKQVTVYGLGGMIPNKKAELNVGSAGTAARFLTAMLALSDGSFLINASLQMQSRPMKPLIEGLTRLGAKFEFLGERDKLPYRIKGTDFRDNQVVLQANISSQFLSALLLSGYKGPEQLEIIIDGEVAAKPYVDMTLKIMSDFGIDVENHSYQRFVIPKGQYYHGRDYTIEPDVSNAAYFLAMAALTGGSVLVKDVRLDSLQGDIKFLNILKQLGCEIEERDEGIFLRGPVGGRFPGIDADLGDTPDQTMTLAALAPFADGPTRIRNVGIIKYHESNRIAAIITELAKLGIHSEETDDGLIIYPGQPQEAAIETYDDHRMAMAFSLIGLKAPGIKIMNPECTAKTFKDYFQVFDEIVNL
ncbi:MAG TPA: 3-phosphoshikimate 1-carboxyvinyltransferase [Bacillota bacterium]|jgi:3-phosphoshikimate 1-carboxyvinyltransferase|nr:3-phosphoshikimate 1-carboxyvinyltransferase [Bacillota bacterium]HOL09683.1 3-phosphoshikimate 1-carboxyvinyltransferase [Bacillota bacterium]HPO97272.1 3-phosphoshikimate 1-carboxyvinyltransferase [Bacillota bacterium]